MKERIKKNWKTKSFLSKAGDAFFLIFVIAMLFPQGRLAIGGAINRVKAFVVEPSIIDDGKLIPENDFNWSLQEIDGSKINLSQSKSKVIFINLWATWCPPCVGEMPEIQALYDRFKDNKNIDFYLITNDKISKIKSFIEKRGYTFPVYHSLSDTPISFRTRSIPTTFVISKSGKIVIQKTGAANWGGNKMIKIVDELIKK